MAEKLDDQNRDSMGRKYLSHTQPVLHSDGNVHWSTRTYGVTAKSPEAYVLYDKAVHGDINSIVSKEAGFTSPVEFLENLGYTKAQINDVLCVTQMELPEPFLPNGNGDTPIFEWACITMVEFNNGKREFLLSYLDDPNEYHHKFQVRTEDYNG